MGGVGGGGESAARDRAKREYTAEELGRHTSRESLWIAVDGGVFDVSNESFGIKVGSAAAAGGMGATINVQQTSSRSSSGCC